MATPRRHFVTLGMFIIDEFAFLDEEGRPTGKTLPSQVSSVPGMLAKVAERAADRWRGHIRQHRGSHLVCVAIAAGHRPRTQDTRYRQSPDRLGMIVDRGHDFPENIQEKLDSFGAEMWLYRDATSRGTTRALNEYKGDCRGQVFISPRACCRKAHVSRDSFRYLTPRIRLTPQDLANTSCEQPDTIHFICSPSRANAIVSEIKQVPGWSPTTIYEPIPVRSRLYHTHTSTLNEKQGQVCP